MQCVLILDMVEVIEMRIRTYKELIRIPTFEERFEYLKLGGIVGDPKFGFDRYINQAFYNCKEWKTVRRTIIIRDNGCDLGIEDREIYDKILIHHINPIALEDIEFRRDCVFDEENLICSSNNTHQAIHYSDSALLMKLPQERMKGDTCLWKHKNNYSNR